jgi:hypothetical protein
MGEMEMTNDEIRMTKEARMTKPEQPGGRSPFPFPALSTERAAFVIRVSSFFGHSSFVIPADASTKPCH